MKKSFDLTHEGSTPAPVCGANGSNGFTFEDAKDEILKNLKYNIHNTLLSQKKVCVIISVSSLKDIIVFMNCTKTYKLFLVTGQAGFEDEYYSIYWKIGKKIF